MMSGSAIFCGQCGEQLRPEGSPTLHRAPTNTQAGQRFHSGQCAIIGQWEPPRWCVHCGRRMVVQVMPTGWTARCAEHGDIVS